MHVVATAGHVDHGKSTLVRALTGMEPDRLEEERRRGLTIELGYAWMTLPSGERLAFVDVPGHERFLSTMLAGVGPAPAVMFVVAADEGWMPQSEEHLLALEALGVRHGLLVVTRADLADPAPAIKQAQARLARTGPHTLGADMGAFGSRAGGLGMYAPDGADIDDFGAGAGSSGMGGPDIDDFGAGAGGLAVGGLGVVEALAVSGRTGQGLADLGDALDRLVTALPTPDPQAPVRLWADRVFSMRGSGTVVTGTLPAGTISVGDELLLPGGTVRVRALESLKTPVTSVTGVARVAVNVRGHDVPERGQALVTPGKWTWTDLIDVRISPVGAAEGDLPRRLTAHIGSAAVVCEVRPLGGRIIRLRLARPLPLHLGDVLLLRDPGRDRSEMRVLAGAVVLDVRPPALRRRGAARDRAAQLAAAVPAVDAGAEPPREAMAARATEATAVPAVGTVDEPPREAAAAWAAGVTDRPPKGAAAVPAGETAAGPPRKAAVQAVQAMQAMQAMEAGAGPDVASALRVHRLLRARDLLAMGCAPGGRPVCGDWYADPAYWASLGERLAEAVRRHAAAHPLEPGMPLDAARHELGLPDRRLVVALIRPPFSVTDGRIVSGPSHLPPTVAKAVERLRAELSAHPFQAPEAGRLAELGLGAKELAAAVRVGALLRVADGIVLLPGADAQAAALLARLPQPFTVSQARQVLNTSRRVAVPLLEHLDRSGLTQRVDEMHRQCRTPSP